jgi:hypothetical protein
MTEREYRAALAITEFVVHREIVGGPEDDEQRESRDNKLIELLFEFQDATLAALEQQ